MLQLGSYRKFTVFCSFPDAGIYQMKHLAGCCSRDDICITMVQKLICATDFKCYFTVKLPNAMIEGEFVHTSVHIFTYVHKATTYIQHIS